VQVHGPERRGGQGLNPDQFESGDRAILALLTDPVVGEQVDLVFTWRAGEGDDVTTGVYEVWSARGMVGFRRFIDDDGRLAFVVVETIGTNPIEAQDPFALATVASERAAAEASGFDASDPAARFIAPEYQTYPFGYERVAQLFDSPNAPDLAVSPRDWCAGNQPGTHGALHVRQARAPLWFSGPGVTAGRHELAARSVDIAPTCLAALGFPTIDGVDAAGRPSSSVLLARQDGRVLDEILDKDVDGVLDGVLDETLRPTRLYVFLLDGMHQTELADRLERDPEGLPNLRRLHAGAAVLDGGSIVNFPSITWPSHTAIVTGTWCGHHDVVNPTYYVREQAETVSPQGLQIGTERFANSAVESLHEAFHRQYPGCLTAAIHAPFGRSARHAVLEGRNLCDRSVVKELTAEFANDMNPRWAVEHPAVASESLLDTRGVAQAVELLRRDDLGEVRFVYHELAVTDGAGHEYGPHHDGLSDALTETDVRIGRVLAELDARGWFDDTLFVVSADHGMAPQDISLRANTANHVLDAGFAAVVAEPMIWLLDVAVVVERKPDLRTARVTVLDNDADAIGERAPIDGAEVVVHQHRQGQPPRELARGRTDMNGLFGFATPSDADSSDITVSVSTVGRNPRRVTLDGERLGIDLRAALYG
jgi:hypothetical protein